MLQYDGVAITRFHAAKYYLAIPCSLDRCAAWCRIIDPPVRAHCFQHGVTPIGIKGRAHAKIYR